MLARQVYTTKSFKLSFPKSLIWADETRTSLPILHNPDGTICEIFLRVFGYWAQSKQVALSSLRDRAYAIRSFLVFLANLGIPWEEVTNATLRKWREAHRLAVAAQEIREARVELKIHYVFHFYRDIPDARRFDEALKPQRAFVGPKVKDRRAFPITEASSTNRKGVISYHWKEAGKVPLGHLRREPPGPTDVATLLEHIRSVPDVTSTSRNHPDAELLHLHHAERIWCMALGMAEGGCRAKEIADMTMQSLLDALRNAKALGSLRLTAEELAMAGGRPEIRNKILADFDKMQAQGQTDIRVRIVGKGTKPRLAPFSIDLMRNLLEVAVWTVRLYQMKHWPPDAGKFDWPNVFISPKSLKPYEPKSISNMMMRAFAGAGLHGSGHLLRGYWSITRAIQILHQKLALSGWQMGPDIETAMLSRVAEDLGHSRVTTTAQYYVDMALVRHFNLPDRSALDKFRGTWATIAQHQASLSGSDLDLVKTFVKSLTTSKKKDALRLVAKQMLADPDFAPESNLAVSQRPPALRNRLNVVK